MESCSYQCTEVKKSHLLVLIMLPLCSFLSEYASFNPVKGELRRRLLASTTYFLQVKLSSQNKLVIKSLIKFQYFTATIFGLSTEIY